MKGTCISMVTNPSHDVDSSTQLETSDGYISRETTDNRHNHNWGERERVPPWEINAPPVCLSVYIYISYVRHFWSRGPRATRKRKPAHLKFKGHMHACCIYVANASLASFPGLRGGGGGKAWYALCAHAR